MKHIFLFILVFLCVNGFVFSENNESKNISADTTYANISVTQARDTILSHAQDPWFVILDVRTPSEFATKHLEEGVNIDFYASNFSTILASLNKNKVYLVHCASGGRSGQVYTMMQNLHFRKVYNMTGGINAWSTATYPTTTSSASIAGALSDTSAVFNNTLLSSTDSIQLTITNAANDLLLISGITGLDGTPFSSNLDTSIQISGARDYSFYVYYQPVDTIADSTIFSIQTNGGTLDFYLFGRATQSTMVKKNEVDYFSMFNDIQSKQVFLTLNTNTASTQVALYDMDGKVVFSKSFFGTCQIPYSSLSKGIYILKIGHSAFQKTIKLPLLNH